MSYSLTGPVVNLSICNSRSPDMMVAWYEVESNTVNRKRKEMFVDKAGTLNHSFRNWKQVSAVVRKFSALKLNWYHRSCKILKREKRKRMYQIIRVPLKFLWPSLANCTGLIKLSILLTPVCITSQNLIAQTNAYLEVCDTYLNKMIIQCIIFL